MTEQPDPALDRCGRPDHAATDAGRDAARVRDGRAPDTTALGIAHGLRVWTWTGPDCPADTDCRARLEIAEKYLAEANEDCREKAAIIDRFVASETELMERCVAAEKRVRELEIDRDKCQRRGHDAGRGGGAAADSRRLPRQ